MQLDLLEPRTMMARTLGTDVSQFQGAINWADVHDAGKEFAFIRATKGNATLDTQLAANAAGAWANGVLAGVYHTSQPDATAGDAVAEANFFLSNARQYMGPGWMRPVLSIESRSTLDKAALSQWASDFSDTIFAAVGVQPLIFTDTDYATNYLDAGVATHDLWLSRWNTNTFDPLVDQPQTPAGYPNPYGAWNVPAGSTTPSDSSWDFWQYTSQGAVSGVDPNVNTVDLDVFQGTRSKLESEFVITAPPAFQLGINFGPYETEALPGYVNVADQTYGDLLGYQMGWTASGAVPVARTGGSAPDARYRTYVRPGYQGVNRSFEVAVPNGTYRVRVVAGSPDEVGSTTKFWAEGTSVINAVTNSINPFLSGVANVAVTDGRLTISSDAAAAPNSRLAFVDIVRVDRAAALPAAPSGVTATPASSTAVDVRWQDDADNEGRDPATFDSTTWGQVREGYEIERRVWDGSGWGAWAVRGYARAGAETYQDTGLTPGTLVQYRVSAVNAAGSSAAVDGAAVTTPTADTPQAYNVGGTPWAVPGTVQAEDFDRGGEGVAYHDTSSGNAGGFYRSGAVDVGRVGAAGQGQYNLGWMRAGEWTAYTVNVPAAGAYVMSFRVANAGSGRKFHASVVQDGVETNLAAGAPGGQWDVPSTGNWNAYTTVYRLVTLPAGLQTIRLYADQAPTGNTTVMNVDWLAVAAPPAIPGPSLVRAGSSSQLALPVGNALYSGVQTWTVDWGDGSAPTTVSNGTQLVSHPYAGGGIYPVTVRATDVGSTPRVVASLTAPVLAAAPPLSLELRHVFESQWTPTDWADEGQYVEAGWDLGGAGDYPAGTYTLKVDWGDGTVAGPSNVAGGLTDPAFYGHVYPDDGDRTVTVTLTDVQGESTVVSQTLHVKNVAPTLRLVGDPGTPEGGTFTLHMSASDPGTDTITSWTIDWGDGSKQDVVTQHLDYATHVYKDSGSFTISATARDEDGAYLARTMLDGAFGSGGKVTLPTVGAAAAFPLPDGRVLVLGVNEWRRLLPDGTPDPTFGDHGVLVPDQLEPGSTDAVTAWSFLPLPDGKVLATAYGQGYDENPGLGPVLVRFKADGTLDDTFDGGGIHPVSLSGDYTQLSLVGVQSTGRIIAYAVDDAGQRLVAFNSNGSEDPNYGTDGIVPLAAGMSRAKMTGDAVLVFGAGVARYTAGGFADPTLQVTGLPFTVTDAVVTVGGNMLVTFLTDNGLDGDFGLARLDPSGVLDTTFGGGDGMVVTQVGGDFDWANNVMVAADGTIVAGGMSVVGAEEDREFGLVRYAPDGTVLDVQRIALAGVYLEDGGFAVLSDGSLLFSGTGADTDTSQPRLALAKVLPRTRATIANVAPTATFANSGPAETGDAVYVSFTGQQDPSPADALAGYLYSYDFDNDGTFEVVQSRSPVVAIPAQYLAPGPFTRVIRACIEDRDGGYTDKTTTVVVRGVRAAGDATTVNEAGTYTITLSSAGLTIKKWHVDWGDGSDPDHDGRVGETFDGTTLTRSHVYADGDENRIIEVVADTDHGVYAAAELPVQIVNVPPQLAAIGSTTVADTDDYVLHLSATDIGQDEVQYWTVNWADGTVQSYPGAAITITHHFRNGPGTYAVTIFAHDEDGSWSTSKVVTVTPAIPVAPSDVHVSSGIDSAVVRWTDKSNNELGFIIERGNGTSFTTVGQVGPGVAEYVDFGAQGGTSYIYRIRAYSSAGESAGALSTSVRIDSDTWVAAPKVTSSVWYWDVRHIVPNDYPQWRFVAQIDIEVPSGTSLYDLYGPVLGHSGLPPYDGDGIWISGPDVTQRAYRIYLQTSWSYDLPETGTSDVAQAFWNLGFVAQSTTTGDESAETLWDPTVSSQPSSVPGGGLNLQAHATWNQFTISWDDQVPVVMNPNPGSYWITTPESTWPSNVLQISFDGTTYQTFNDAGPAYVEGEYDEYPGLIHSALGFDSRALPSDFYIRLVSRGFDSEEYGTPIHVVRDDSDYLPGPTNLVARAVSGKINLYWADNSTNETGFVVYRRVAGDTSSFSPVATTAANVTQYSDASGAEGATYEYYVVAKRGDVLSDPSNTDVATMPVTTGTVTGTVFDDANANGWRDGDDWSEDPTEGPLAGVWVYADYNGNGTWDASDHEPRALTRDDGTYTLPGLRAGRYNIRVQVSSGLVTYPTSTVRPVDIEAGQEVDGVDFGVYDEGTPTVGSVYITPPAAGVAEGSLASFTAHVKNPAETLYDFVWSVVVGDVTYQFNPGTDVQNNATSSVLSFRPDNDGQFQVSVIAYVHGTMTIVGRDSLTYVVRNVAPTGSVDVSPGQAVAVRQEVKFTATGHDVSTVDNGDLHYEWSVTRNGIAYPIPGGAASSNTLTWTPAEPGTYVATVRIRDDDDFTDVVGPAVVVRGPVDPEDTGHLPAAVYGIVYFSEDFSPAPSRDESDTYLGDPLGGYRVYDDQNNDGAWEADEPFTISRPSRTSYPSSDSSEGLDGNYYIGGLDPTVTHHIRVDLANPGDVVHPEQAYACLVLAPGEEGVRDIGLHPQLKITTTPEGTFVLNPHTFQDVQIGDTPWNLGDIAITVRDTNSDDPGWHHDIPDDTPDTPATWHDHIVLIRRDQQPTGEFILLQRSALTQYGPNDLSDDGEITFDQAGRLLISNYHLGTVARLGTDGQTVQSDFISVRGDEGIVVDEAGNIYVAGNAGFYGADDDDQRRSGIYKFDKDGNLLGILALGVRVDEFSLAPDQHTIIFDSGQADSRLFRLDADTGDISAFADLTDVAQGVKVVAAPEDPAGWEVVSTEGSGIVVFNSAGTLLRSFGWLPGGDWFTPKWADLEIDPSGPYVWVDAGIPSGAPGFNDTASHWSWVEEYNYETGVLLHHITIGDALPGGMAVFTANPGSGEVGSQFTYRAVAASDVDAKFASLLRPADIPPNQQLASLRGPEGLPIRYSIQSMPDGVNAQIDPVTGLFAWTPTKPGTYHFVIRAREYADGDTLAGAIDDSRTWFDQPFDVVVGPSGPNDPPYIDPGQSMPDGRVGVNYTARVTASDPDHDQLTYSLVASPISDARIDPVSGILSFTAAGPQAGDQVFTVRVTDGRGSSSDADVTVHVQPAINPTNAAPQILTDLQGQTFDVQAGSLFTLDQIGLRDNDLQDRYSLVLTATQKPAGMASGLVRTTDGSYGRIVWQTSIADVRSTPYDVTLQVSDGRGGVTTQSFKIRVLSAKPVVSGVNVSDGTDPDRQKVLTVTSIDPAVINDATFTWAYTGSGLPTPQLVRAGAGQTANVTFSAVGDYSFSVVANYVMADGTTRSSDPFPVTVHVAAVIGRIVPTLQSNVVVARESGDTDPEGHQLVLGVTTYDQFNSPMAIPAGWTFSWRDSYHIENSSGPTCVYTAGESATTDTIHVVALLDGRDTKVFTVIRVVTMPFDPTAQDGLVNGMAGTVATGLYAVEAEPTAFGTAGGHDHTLGAFIDVRTLDADRSSHVVTFDPARYTVSVEWGDGTVSAGGLVALGHAGLTLPPGTPVELLNYYCLITGSHQYAQEGLYQLAIHITSPDGRSIAIRSEAVNIGGLLQDSVYVDSAPLVDLSAVHATAVIGRPFEAVLARFTDPAPVTDASHFAVKIIWGDGTTTGPNRTLHDYTIRAVSPGVYEVVSAHTYNGYGAPPAKLIIYEDDARFGNPGYGVVRAQIDLDVTVGAMDLTVPSKPQVTVLAPDAVSVAWAANRETWGYQITRIQYDAAGHVLSRQVLPATDQATVSNPYTDTGLDPSTRYAYTVTAVDQYLNASDASPASDVVTTFAPLVVPAPEVTAAHTIAVDPATNSRGEGVQLLWPALPPGSNLNFVYKVERRAGASGPFVPLLLEGRGIDPADRQPNGEIGYFDDFGSGVPFADGTTSYTYRVYAVDMHGNRINGGTIDVVVHRDTQPPTVPTGVSAASYPQAIQLTWDDRPPQDDVDWSGWNIYRADGPNGPWTRLNADPVSAETGYDDFTVGDPGHVYWYKVSSVDVFGNEAFAAPVSHRRSDHGEPLPPASVTAIPAGTSILLTWQNVVPVIDQGHDNDALKGYRVYWSTQPNFKPADGTLLATIQRALPGDDLPSASCPDTSVGANVTRYYAVVAFDFDGDESNPAYGVGRTGSGTYALPTGPSGLDVATGTLTETAVKIIWTGVAGANGYAVFRRLAGDASFALVAALPSGSTPEFADHDLSPDRTYEYQVYAVDAGGNYSAPATVAGGSATVKSVHSLAFAAEPPRVGIDAPGAAVGGGPVVVTTDLTVTGFVDDRNDNLHHWRLVLRPATATDASSDRVISADTHEAGHYGGSPDASVSVALGHVTAALVPDGLYRLILLAFDDPSGKEDAAGHFNSTEAASLIQIKSDVKLGSFTLPVVDLTLDLPGGQTVSVTRTYDSQHANLKGDFGYGWTLDLNQTSYRTTAAQSEINSATSTLRFGDLVYVTIPGQGQHVFAFVPRPTNYDPQLSADPTSFVYAGASYAPQFVAVDGSNAILTVPRDGGDDADPFFLSYMAGQGGAPGEFFAVGEHGQVPYNPADAIFGDELRVKTADGTRYFIDAATGRLKASESVSGQRTDYDGNSAAAALRLDVVRYTSGPQAGLVQSVRVLNSAGEQVGKSVTYTYDPTTLDLISVTGQDGGTTGYAYAEGGASAHYLTTVTDARSVPVLHVTYDRVTGEMVAARDALGNAANVSSGSFNGTSARTTVTDPASAAGGDGQSVQVVQDNHGNVVREIRTIRQGGVVTGYVVTVHEYDYADGADDIEMMVDYGVSDVNALTAVRDYDPISLPANATLQQLDTARGTLRHARTFYGFQESLGDALTKGDYVRNVEDPDFRQLETDTTYDDDGRARTTRYSAYKLGKPQIVTNPDGLTTYTKYNDQGFVEWTSNALGEGTRYEYVPTHGDGFGGPLADDGNPGNLVWKTYRIIVQNPQFAFDADDGSSPTILSVGARTGTATNRYAGNYFVVGGLDGELTVGMWATLNGRAYEVTSLEQEGDNVVVHLAEDLDEPTTTSMPVTFYRPTQTNTYYDDSAPAGSRWKLRTTTDAAGATTWYVYDDAGRQVVTANLRPESMGGHYRWLISETQYDAAGRVTETSSYSVVDYGTGTYLDVGDRVFSWHAALSADGVTEVVVDEGPIVTDRQVLSKTEYGPTGKVARSIDAYGAATAYHYDDNGNLIETVNPDGTRTDSVYDLSGRVVLSVDRFRPGQTGPVVAMRTIYDAQGRAAQVQRLLLSASDVDVTQDPTNPTIYRVTSVTNAGLTRHTNATTGTVATQPDWFTVDPNFATSASATRTYYDVGGRVIETVSADGLRTGTVYDGTGRVVYTGPLKSSAPAGAAGRTDGRFLLTDFASYGQTLYDAANVDTLHVAGDFRTNDSVDLTFTAIALAGNSSSYPTVTLHIVVGSSGGLASLLAAIAAAINAHTNAAAGDPLRGVTATVDVAGGAVHLSIDDDHRAILCQVEAHDDNTDDGAVPSIYTTATRHSTATRDPLGHWTVAFSDALGRPTLTVAADGTYTETLYAAPGQPVAGHAVAGQIVDGTQVTKVDALGHATDYFYDFAGRLTDVYLPAVTDANPDSPDHGHLVRPHWQYTYDAYGNQLSQTAPATYAPTSFGGPGRLLGGTTTFEYDVFGRRTTRQAPGFGQRERWMYDARGRVLAHWDGAGRATWYVYDDVNPAHGGRLIAEYRYDHDVDNTHPTGGATWGKDYADTTRYQEKTEYVYDDDASLPAAEQLGMGRLVEVRDYVQDNSQNVQLDTWTHTTFDPATGQPATITTPEGTVNYAYDLATGRHTRTWTDHNDTLYDYDAFGRLWHVKVLKLNDVILATYNPGTGVISGTPQVTTYTYDDAGNLKTVTQPDGLTTTYSYNAVNRLTEEKVTTTGNAVVSDYQYHARADGLRDWVVEDQKNADGTFSHTKITWSYDDDGRLVGESRDENYGATGLTTDSHGMTAGDYTDTFAYDPNGNRVLKIHDAYGTTDDETVIYTYNDGDRLWSETGTDANTGNIKYETDYRYDNSGNQDYVGHTGLGADEYKWDLRGRMIEARVGSSVTTYTYSTDGVRVSQATTTTPAGQSPVTGPTTFYVIDPLNPTGYAKAVEEKTGTSVSTATVSRSYVLGLRAEGQSECEVTGHGTLYFLTDGHGSTRALVKTDGTIGQRFDYDAFGTLLSGPTLTTAADAHTTWLFGGDGVYDPATGWTYHLSRWRQDFRFASYDSYEGDPSSPTSLHKYVYANVNPITNWDPAGTTSEGEQLTVTGIQGGLQGILNSATHLVLRTVPARLVTAFAAGGAAIGRTWNWLGEEVSDIAEQVMGLFPQLQRVPQSPIGQKVIDFTLRASDKVANLELKYKIPSRVGDSLNRLVAQMNAMVTEVPAGEQAVVWTLKAPTMAEMQRLQQVAGPAFNQVQFVHGVMGLYQWIKLYFGL